jgi:hypothetical protein
MNRRWIFAIVGTLALSAWSSVQAAPLANVFVEGRIQGTTTWSAGPLTVAPGNVVEYRLVADMAALGTTNATKNVTINSLANSGLQSLTLAVTQAPSDTITVDLNTPPDVATGLRNGWGLGIGASTGLLKPRTPGGLDDLRHIRPIRATGTFSAVDPEVMFEGGSFTVTAAPAGGMGILLPTWSETPTGAGGTGALRVNGAGSVFISTADQTSADPPIGFTGLSLVAIPEPSTIALVGMGLVGLVALARRRRSA